MQEKYIAVTKEPFQDGVGKIEGKNILGIQIRKLFALSTHA
jgi:hypothetical protein